jgi:antitoxin component YwqK of YwqJK toxin-antitoxin module
MAKNTNPKKFYYDDGNLRVVRYYYGGGFLHREDGPAEIYYYEDGRSVYAEIWSRIDFYTHRLDGPAVTRYYKDGTKRLEAWYIKGRCHKVDGPAKIWYSSGNGNIDEVEFWFEGDKEGALWKIYDQASPEIQKTLLRDWLQYHV